MAGKLSIVPRVFDSLDTAMLNSYNIQVEGTQNYLGNTQRSSRYDSSSEVKSRLLSASKSLEAYKQKTKDRLCKQQNLQKQQQGLHAKTRDFDAQMDEFIENYQQLSSYSTELQRELLDMKKTKESREKIRNQCGISEEQGIQYENQINVDMQQQQIGDGVMKSEKSVIVEDWENDSSIGNCQKQPNWEIQQKQQPAAAYYKTKMATYQQNDQVKSNLIKEGIINSSVNYASNNSRSSYNDGSNQCNQSLESPAVQSISQYITVKKRKKLGNEEINHCASNFSTNSTHNATGVGSNYNAPNTARSNMAELLKEQAEEIEKMETKIKELTAKNQDLKSQVVEKTEELLQKEEAGIVARKSIESLEESVLLKTTEIFNLRERLDKKEKEQEMMKEVIAAQKEEINKLEGDIDLQRTEILVLKSRSKQYKNAKPAGSITTFKHKGLKLDDNLEQGASASPQTAKKHQVLVSPVHKLMPRGLEDAHDRISGSVDFHERKQLQQSSSRSILTQPSTQRSVCKNLDSTRQEDNSLLEKQPSYSIQCLGKELSSYQENLKKPTQSQIKLLWISQGMPNQQNTHSEITNLTSPTNGVCRDILNETTAVKNRSSSLLSQKQSSLHGPQQHYFQSPQPTAPCQLILEMHEQAQYQSATQTYSQQNNLNLISSNHENNSNYYSNSQNYPQTNNSSIVSSNNLLNQTHAATNLPTVVAPPRSYSLMNSNKPVINLGQNQQKISQCNSIQKQQLQGMHSPTQQNISILLRNYQQQQQQSCVKASQHQINSIINPSVLTIQQPLSQQQQPAAACI